MNTKKNNAIGIVGFGRFGKLLAHLLEKDFDIHHQDMNENSPFDFVPCPSTIFIAVPIRAFAETIKTIAPTLSTPCTIIDVCSVKLYPVRIMEQYLPPHIGIIATHPLFGPDSIKEMDALKMMMYPVRDNNHCFAEWKNYFLKKNITPLEMTPDEHDRIAAKTQSLTHFIGRCLQTMGAQSTPIDTHGFQKLLSVMDQTCHDSFELFIELIRFNPYALPIIKEFIATTENLQQLVID